MAGPISEQDEREYYAEAWALIDAEAESSYYAAWLDPEGHPVIEDTTGYEDVADAMHDADLWRATGGVGIVVVQGLRARRIVAGYQGPIAREFALGVQP